MAAETDSQRMFAGGLAPGGVTHMKPRSLRQPKLIRIVGDYKPIPDAFGADRTAKRVIAAQLAEANKPLGSTRSTFAVTLALIAQRADARSQVRQTAQAYANSLVMPEPTDQELRTGNIANGLVAHVEFMIDEGYSRIDG